MLAALFVAAKREGMPCLPYARELIRLGLRAAGERLDRIDPLLCQQLLADRLEDADWESRFLTGSWQTLVSRTWPLLTERVVRTFGGSDFRPADLLGKEPTGKVRAQMSMSGPDRSLYRAVADHV